MSSPVGAYVADQLARWGFTAEMESFVSRLEEACWPVTHNLANPKLTSCITNWRQNISQLGQVIFSVCYWLYSTAGNSCDRNLHLYLCPWDCAPTSGYKISSIECRRYSPNISMNALNLLINTSLFSEICISAFPCPSCYPYPYPCHYPCPYPCLYPSPYPYFHPYSYP